MSETFFEMRQRLVTPPLIASKDQYHVMYASTPEEVQATQRLRYSVFCEEQGKGVEHAVNGIDQDEFDEFCMHLIVRHEDEKLPVGTYRINIGPMANCDIGFYSSREFDIHGFDAIRSKTLEVGRSCVSHEYRNGTVVALLWAGISETLGRTKMHYLTGCASLEDMRPAAAWAVYDSLKSQGKLSETVQAEPRKPFELMRPDQKEIDAILNNPREFRKVIPPLFKGYLRMGGKICGPPAFDFEFGTADFLILLDTTRLPERYNKHFNVPEAE